MDSELINPTGLPLPLAAQEARSKPGGFKLLLLFDFSSGKQTPVVNPSYEGSGACFLFGFVSSRGLPKSWGRSASCLGVDPHRGGRGRRRKKRKGGCIAEIATVGRRRRNARPLPSLAPRKGSARVLRVVLAHAEALGKNLPRF